MSENKGVRHHCPFALVSEIKGVRHRFPSIVGSEDVELHIAANCCFVCLWCKPELEG